MYVKEIVEKLVSAGIEPKEADIEARMLIEHFCNYSAVDIFMGKHLDENLLAVAFEKACERASSRKPIQYIIGQADFMGEKFIVNKDVLIPRDDTEILVRRAIELIQKNGLKQILDLGTGSGCIACMIAKHTQAKVLGVDISSDALRVALDNAARFNLFNKAIFRKSDLFSGVTEKFDLIVSNPPYIKPSLKSGLQKELYFEPEAALFTADCEGVEFYEKISSEAANYLNKNGYLLFEVGQGQAQTVEKIMTKYGFGEIKIEKDISGISRVVFGICPNRQS